MQYALKYKWLRKKTKTKQQKIRAVEAAALNFFYCGEMSQSNIMFGVLF